MNIRFALPAFLLSLTTLPICAQSNSTQTSDPSTEGWKTLQHDKHLTIRVNPAADLSAYPFVTLGGIEYSGPSRKLSPSDADKLTSILRQSLTKDLAATEELTTATTTGTLRVNVDITSARRTHTLINVATTAAVKMPLDRGKAKVTATLVDAKTGLAIAEMDASGSGKLYQVLAGLRPLGQTTAVLKHESKAIAGAISKIRAGQPSTLPAAIALTSSE